MKGMIAFLFLGNLLFASALLVKVQMKGIFTVSGFVQCILSPPFMVDGRTSTTYFFDSVGDCFWMAVLQLVLFPLIAWGAVCSTRMSEQTDAPSCCGCYRCFYRIGVTGQHEPADASGRVQKQGQSKGRRERQERVQQRYQKLASQGQGADRSVPLLDGAEEVGDEAAGVSEAVRKGTERGDKSGDKSGDRSDDKDGDKRADKDDDSEDDDGSDQVGLTAPSLEGFEAEDLAHQNDTRRKDESYLSARSVAHNRRTSWLALLFVVSTLMQCYLGLKCISFEFQDETTEVQCPITPRCPVPCCYDV